MTQPSWRHGKLTWCPAFPKIVILGLPAFQIIAQQAAKGAVFEIAIVRERVDRIVRPAGVAIVDARELDLLVVELLFLLPSGRHADSYRATSRAMVPSAVSKPFATW